MDKTDPSEAEDTATLIAHANRLAPKLASAADALNHAIALAEDEVAKLMLGVTASVPLQLPDDDDHDDFERALTFGKMGDKWRFIVESGPVTDPNRGTSTPLLNASKEIRLAAVDLFQELLLELVTEATKQAAEITAKASQALEFANSVARSAASVSTGTPGTTLTLTATPLSAALNASRKK